MTSIFLLYNYRLIDDHPLIWKYNIIVEVSPQDVGNKICFFKSVCGFLKMSASLSRLN